ncbi:uncharacterized protein LOC127799878 isoform X2 [Diospyros lotus]|uniref:uncharacterized protein LOC127799878 isoform X2 n=1 Tax=Diospyros lotus TaxID=55363 RepID=UPI0022539FB9|nr:uncharacterized protein LOC127799878 isoform X2 [Diospyros lotus]
MFVKKLVEKASKKHGGIVDGLKSEDIDPRLVFHYGVPSGSVILAYDSIQQILAISTKDGRIKLYGKGNTQAILESPETIASKFLEFFENQGILLNVNANNQIEVWDLERNFLSHVHDFKDDITSFTVMQQSLYMFVGDSVGNVSVLKLDQEPCNIIQMKYRIPLFASHGNTSEVAGDTYVVHILLQPTAESKRVLIIYRDGFITLWAIQESKAIFTTGGIMLPAVSHETKKVTAACWACPYGSKVAVGYSNGEICIWNVPSPLASKTEPAPDKDSVLTQSAPICKLNIGYKLDKIPIASLKWAYADGKASRLYVMGASDNLSANLVQVVLLNELAETRTIKLGLHLSEPCVHMEIISSSNEDSKHKQDAFLLIGKSSHIYSYDDHAIEKYLLQCQSRSPPSLPMEIMVKLPFSDSSITVAKFITDNPYFSGEQGNIMMENLIPPLFPFDTRQKDLTQSMNFSRFSKSKNLYITGHMNGAINFWDASCPVMVPVASIVQQSEDDFSLSGVALTALYFDGSSRLLITGDQSGMIRLFNLKPEPFISGSSFLPLQGSSKKRSNHIVQSLKLVKVNGSVLSVDINCSSGHLAVGSDQGYVSLIDMEGPTLLYQRHITSELCTGIISLQFETCNFHGFEKNVLVVATKDSSVFALERDTGNTLGSGLIRPKKPSRAFLMQILDGQDTAVRESNKLEGIDPSKRNSTDDATPKRLSLLLCAEKAAYVYSLVHVVQGIKKVLYKKKFNNSCCWASTFYTTDAAGLVLLFADGKIEIRSLPELSLLKETSITGLTLSSQKLNSVADSSVCSSWDGELIIVNRDQEMFVVSVLLRKDLYGHLDSVSQVYNKDLIVAQGVCSEPATHKEKKKGLFSSVIKDMTRSKSKHMPGEEVEGARESMEGLSTIFSVDNFPPETGNIPNPAADESEVLLDIGKLKEIKVKNEKSPAKEEPQHEKASSVDQIKKKYGFSTSGDSSVAKMAESKLSENLRKLQGISLRTTQMEDTARSFSSMAKEVLRIAENDKRSS